MNAPERSSTAPPPLGRGDMAALLALFAFGVAYCYYFGRIGFMPLDHSIVFDGGWRILCGQVPFRDFFAPYGIVPALFQALAFATLGVNWFAFVLHAAVTNGLFAVVVYLLLRSAGAGRWLAALHAALSGVVFYPPVGVPFPDQHAWFFTLLLVYLGWSAARTPSLARRTGLLVALPPVALLGLLCKQIPTLPGAVVAVTLAFAATRNGRRSAREGWRALALGAVGTAVAVALALRLEGIDARQLADHLWSLPAELGTDRIARLTGRDALTRVGRLFSSWSTGIPLLLTLSAGGAALIAPSWLRGRAGSSPGGADAEADAELRRRAAVALSLTALSLGFVALTHNHRASGVPTLFLSLGLVAIAFDRKVAAPEGGAPADDRASPARRRLPPRPRFSAALAALSVLCAAGFHREIVAPRAVNDMRVSLPVAASAWSVRALEPLVWIVPPAYGARAGDVEDVVRFFAENPGNFLLFGDTSILYALTGRPSASPVLWFHAGLTYPRPGDRGFTAFDASLVAAVERQAVRYLVLEAVQGPKGPINGWLGLRVEQFPEIRELLARRGEERARYGPFTILELRGAEASTASSPRPTAGTGS